MHIHINVYVCVYIYIYIYILHNSIKCLESLGRHYLRAPVQGLQGVALAAYI